MKAKHPMFRLKGISGCYGDLLQYAYVPPDPLPECMDKAFGKLGHEVYEQM